MQFFGGQAGKTLLQVKAHLVAENAARTGTGTVAFVAAVIHDMSHQIQILLHNLPFLVCSLLTPVCPDNHNHPGHYHRHGQ